MSIEIKPRAMRDAFLEEIWKAMAQDEKIFFTCADFGSPVLDKIRADYPDRFVNVGVAEQSLINVSAGLALEGYKVFAYAIAPFITMRCYEQIRVSLALLSEIRPMNVNLIGVGAGYSYVVSGPTHQCYEDITLMRAMPNITVLSPSDHVTAASMFNQCLSRNGPKYLRFDAQVLPPVYQSAPDVADGFHVHKKGMEICLIATGYMLHTAIKVADHLKADGMNLGVIDLYNISGFDRKKMQTVLENYKGIVSLEEGFSGRGGMDAMLFDFLNDIGSNCEFLNIGVEGKYRFDLGTRNELHEQVGIGSNALNARIKKFSEKLIVKK